jgi:NAD/NADP transhydrogenase alpha subunit
LLSRVSLTPVVAAILSKKGFSVKVEKGAGAEAKFRDSDYAASGASVVDRNSVFESGWT